MCGSLLGNLLGGAREAPAPVVIPAAPPVVRETPKVDQAKIEADAAARAQQQAAARRRRVRSSSLLASGGAGDPTSPLTTATSGKPTLGA